MSRPVMLFQAHSLFLAFRPVFWLSRLFGTMPFRLELEPKARIADCPISRFYAILCLLTCTCHAFLTPMFVTGDSKTASTLVMIEIKKENMSNLEARHRNHTSVQMVALRLMNPLVVSFMCIGSQIVVVLYLRKDLPQFLDDLALLDSSLCTILRSRPERDSRISWIAILYFFVISIPVTLFYLTLSYIIVPGWEFLWNFILTMNNNISFLVDVQFIYLAYLLCIRFRQINAYLKSHIYQDPKAKYITLFKKSFPGEKRLNADKLKALHWSSQCLFELMHRLNALYQLQLLCSLSGSFVKILLNIYFALFSQYGESFCIQIFKIFFWTFFYSVRFFCIVLFASRTSNEANKVKSSVAGVNPRNLSPDVKEELESFLNHSSTWSINFTACDLFTVNTSLIMSAIATGSTYLIVLVQFRPQF